MLGYKSDYKKRCVVVVVVVCVVVVVVMACFVSRLQNDFYVCPYFRF